MYHIIKYKQFFEKMSSFLINGWNKLKSDCVNNNDGNENDSDCLSSITFKKCENYLNCCVDDNKN